jgi:acetyltransferase-like isoleucine patch superfamily enzyme
MISIASSARVSSLADIEDSVRGTKIIIGADSVIESFVKIKPTGGDGDFILGNRSHINAGCAIYTGNGIHIGNDVLVAANCTFAPVNHEYRRRDTKIVQQRFLPSKGGIVIEDDVWIGANCVLLDGTVIRCGAVVGACSLVRGELEPYGIYVGNPLKLIGHRE